MASGVKVSPELFIQRASEIHSNYYDYSKTKYTRMKDKVVIICPVHGEFSQEAKAHVKGRKCVKCAMDIRSKAKLESRQKNSKVLEDYALIPLTKGKFAKVSLEDFKDLSKYIWTTDRGYASNVRLGLMHRYLLNAPKHLEVDHKNRDRSDNRRCNLRLATRPQNQWNRGNIEGKYRGVTYRKLHNTWRSRITYLGKDLHIGDYQTAAEAARAYNAKAKELYGEFANLNKIV